MTRFSKKVGKCFGMIEKDTLLALKAYDWPGNVRELQNVIERAVILSDSTFEVDEGWLKSSSPEIQQAALSGALLIQEKEAIEMALARCKGRVAGPDGAAARLGIPSSTLDYKIKRLRIDKFRFRSPGA
jgi:transcriptional regulator with PAS, ATPase and Fis domain